MIMHITAYIVVEDADPELVDAFTDRLMEALMSQDTIDPDVGGSLQNGQVEVGFYLAVESTAEGQAIGARLLHEAVQAAGLEPEEAWTDIPGRPNRASLENFLTDHPDMVRQVRAELEPA